MVHDPLRQLPFLFVDEEVEDCQRALVELIPQGISRWDKPSAPGIEADLAHFGAEQYVYLHISVSSELVDFNRLG